MFIRVYAESGKHWDDGVGFVIAGESERAIDQYVKFTKWNDCAHQTFRLQQRDKVYLYYGDVMIAKEVTKEGEKEKG